MKKKILLVLICGIMFLGITACKKNEVKNNLEREQNEINEKQYENISTLKSDKVDTKILIKFDDVLYGRSFAIIDYAVGTESIGIIDKLIDKQYVPMINGETNNEQILNALVYDKGDNTIVLFYNNEYVLFEKIIR